MIIFYFSEHNKYTYNKCTFSKLGAHPLQKMRPLGARNCTPFEVMHPPKMGNLHPLRRFYQYISPNTKIWGRQKPTPYFCCAVGLEESNPTCRGQVGGEGWTEPNHNFCQRQKCKRVPPAHRTAETHKFGISV